MKFQKKVEKKTRKPLTIKTKYHEYFWWAAPIIPFFEFYDWANRKMDARQKWDEEKASHLLNKYILPHYLEWVEEEKAFYYAWIMSPEYSYDRLCPRRYGRWLRKHGYWVQQYLRDGYENSDYIKTRIVEYGDTWIKFEERA